MLQTLKLTLAPPLWRVFCATVNWPRLPRPDLDAGPCIFACLHRDILPAIRYVQPARPALLVSHSPDGDILLRTLGRRHYRFVRGGSGDKGELAFRRLLKELQAGHSVGVAVDGPKGPFGEIQEGILHLARLSGAGLVPLRAHAPHAWVLPTWDRTVVPRPWRPLSVVSGPRLELEATAGPEDLATVKNELKRFFAEEGDALEGA